MHCLVGNIMTPVIPSNKAPIELVYCMGFGIACQGAHPDVSCNDFHHGKGGFSRGGGVPGEP